MADQHDPQVDKIADLVKEANPPGLVAEVDELRGEFTDWMSCCHCTFFTHENSITYNCK